MKANPRGFLKNSEPGNTNNLAIIGLNVLRQQLPGKKGAGPGPSKLLAFVRVANYRSTPAPVRIRLDVHELLLDKGDKPSSRVTHPLQAERTIPERKYAAETPRMRRKMNRAK